MARLILFHHALGLTDGVRSFADELRKAGHTVETPDLYGGRTFRTVSDGVDYARSIGMEVIAERGVEIARHHEVGFFVAGFSLGVLASQKTAQTLPGVAGAISYYGTVAPSVFGGNRLVGVPLQVHLGEFDELAVEDLDSARELASSPNVELFVYPTSGHLVADIDSPDYDAAIAATIVERTLAFLADAEG